MAIDNKILEGFFSKQRKPDISALVEISEKDAAINAVDKNLPEKHPKKTDSKLIANKQKTGSKLVANRQHTDSKPIAIKKQTGSATDSKTDSKPIANQQQLFPYSSLVGLQKKIVNVIHTECINNRSTISPQLSLEYIASIVTARKNTIKDAINRLEKKRIIIRSNFKAGRGGWSQYEIAEGVHSEIMREEKQINRQQTDSKPIAQPIAQPIANTSSSSSFFINKNTTTSKTSENENFGDTDPQWGLDISSLESFGFTQNHLDQIARTKLLEPHLVQECIYAFANDLNQGLVQCESSPINFFMGIVKKGRLYTPKMKGYESPREQLMRSFIEREKHLKAQREEVEEKLRKKACGQWLATLDVKEQMMMAEKAHEELQSVTGENVRFHPARVFSTLESYFTHFLWLEKRQACYEENGLSEIFSEPP